MESKSLNYEWKEIEGWLDPTAAMWLYNKACSMDSVLEVGSWKGRSTHPLASGCKGTVFCVDHWQGSKEELDATHNEAKEKDIFVEFQHNISEFKHVVPIKLPSLVASKFFAYNSIDMIYIDAGHTYDEVLADFVSWKPKCKKLFCGHDYDLANIEKISDELKIRTRPVGLCSIWESY